MSIMDNYSLKKFLISPINPLSLPYVLLGLGAIGFLDAGYLTLEHYRRLIPPCTLHGCDLVLTSQYSTIFGIPIAAIGAVFYLAVMIVSLIILSLPQKSAAMSHSEGKVTQAMPVASASKRWFTRCLFILCSLGFAVGLVLIYLQAFVLHAFCQYCLLSELIDFLLFDTSWWLYNSLS